mgnify:CR=1 FL=1
MLYAVLPQVVPQFLSFTMYRWDINVRESSVLGFVGAGGLGSPAALYLAAAGVGTRRMQKASRAAERVVRDMGVWGMKGRMTRGTSGMCLAP